MALFRVDGMSCEGCVRSIANAVRKVVKGAEIHVDLTAGTVDVAGDVDESAIRTAVEQAGFTFKGVVAERATGS